MKRIVLRQAVLAIVLLLFQQTLFSQAFTFNCSRDTLIPGCSPNPCVKITTLIPDLHRSTDTYTLNPITTNGSSCFPAYSDPSVTGTPTNLTSDDTYTAPINIGFPFPFYGTYYNNLVVSTNGMLSFDASRAFLFAHWNIINGGFPQNLPSAFYDRAIIMGPYHDLDPTALTSPTQRIQHVTTGTAPHRKWILSFYRVPLYNCPSLIENTHQIVLHESTGIIEVLIFGKQVCNTWNQGRAMVGIQNFNRDQAMMAPGRRATDPPWGNINMNESWRFVPSAGPSLFKRVELYDIGGNLISTGTANSLGNGTLEAEFPDVCPPAGATTTYIIRSVYEKIDDPAVEIFGTDTVRVIKGPPADLNATFTTTPSSCGVNSGTITVNVPAGTGAAPFEYILDGGTPQAGNVFTNMAQGNYVVQVNDAGGCSSTLNVAVGQTGTLSATITTVATACPGVNNGSAAVTPTNGTGPYNFTVNPGALTLSGATANFTGLAAGSYSVSITDNAGCATATPIPFVIAAGAGLNSTQTTTTPSCNGAANGSITINTLNGSAPYTFTLNPGSISQASNIFTNLAAGNYSISYTDGAGCVSAVIPVTVPAGPSLTTTSTATNALCNGSATGSITVTQPAAGTPPYEYSIDGGANWQTSNVFNGLSANTYTILFRESNGCQGQLTQVVNEPMALAATLAQTAVVCNGQSNGVITVTASGGTGPYQYSIDGGTNWQPGNIFNVAAGSYTITTRDNNLCTITGNIVVTEPPVLTATAATTNATCNGGPDGTITVAAAGGNSSYQYSIDGTNFQASNVFNVIAGNYTVYVRDNLGCSFSITNVTVGLTDNLTYNTPVSPVICEGTSTQLQVVSNAIQYAWSPATGLSNPGIANPVANPSVTTTYTVTLTLGNCSVTIPYTVNVNPAPVPDAGPDGFICYGQNYQLQGSGGVQYNWSPSNFLSSSSISNPVATPDNTTTYALSVVDGNGCQSLVTDNVTVDVTPPITVTTFPSDTIVHEGHQFQIRAVSIATNYSWTPSVGLNNPFVADPVVTAGSAGDVIIYEVAATTLAGCRGDGTVRVRVYKGPDIYMPTAFTPNNDGRNDIFRPFTVGINQINYFRIFNRSGQELFSTKNLGAGWDGKLGGVDQPSAVYIWMVQGVTEDGRVITKKGTVALIR